jgi:hypothetical protein
MLFFHLSLVCQVRPDNERTKDLVRVADIMAEHKALEDAVVYGAGTIKQYEMPFVNRHEELWQIFCVNAENNIRALEMAHEDATCNNFRIFNLFFCVQVLDTKHRLVCVVCNASFS